MCQLTYKSIRQSVFGYKVVAEQDGKFYSPAMGIEYKNNEFITIPKRQNSISKAFTDGILEWLHEPRMEGRTAVFLYEESAIERCLQWIKSVISGFTLRVVPAIVYDDVLEGHYDFGLDLVAAGRKIYFPDLEFNHGWNKVGTSCD